MKHDYSYDPNFFVAERVAVLVTATFASKESDRDAIIDSITRHLKWYQSMDKQSPWTKSSLKEIRKVSFESLSQLIKTGHCNMIEFENIYNLEPNHTRALNMIMTLARWADWYLLKEDDLRDISNNMSEHIGEINALNFYENGKRICPYKPGILSDLDTIWEAIQIQEQNVFEYCADNGFRAQFTAQELWDAMQQLVYDLQSPAYIPKGFEVGFFNSIKYIRKNNKRVIGIMTRYAVGEARAEDYGLAETTSVLNEYPNLIQVLKLAGWPRNKMPNVLANIFHCQYPGIKLMANKGQIVVEIDAEYFTAAPGLGPGKKVRYVFNTSIEIQNFLSPLAKLIKEADESNDILAESYVNQTLGLQTYLGSIKDAFCIDATGYSDYLFRGVYEFLLELYGLPDWIVESIMAVFKMPIRIDGKNYPVEFGSLQGCKLLVFVMNHANRLIGILSQRIRANKDPQYRCNAGDDVVTFNFQNDFEAEDMDTELTCFAFFNCAINKSKTAWLKRDGYFDFCSKYFYKEKETGQVVSITGIPPKLIGKQMLSIKSFTEIFRVLKTSLVTERNSIGFVWSVAKILLRQEFEYGLELPNSLDKKWTFDEKERAALLVPFSIGGLAEEGEIDVAQTAQHVILLLEKYLERYRFDATGVFSVIRNLGIEDSPLFQALGSMERFGIAEVVDTIAFLKRAVVGEAVTQEEVDRAALLVTKLDRCIIKGISISNSSSTYHRITATRDIDNFFDESLKKETPLVDSLVRPGDTIELAMMMHAASSLDYTELDQLRIYIHNRAMLNTVKDRIVKEKHGYYTNFYIIDDDNKRIKLTTDDREVGPNKSGKYKSVKDCINPKIKSIAELLMGHMGTIQYIINEFAEWNIKTGREELFELILATIKKSNKAALRQALIDYDKRRTEEDMKRWLKESFKEFLKSRYT